MLSETSTRGTGCLNWARPGLWGLRVGDCPVLPGEVVNFDETGARVDGKTLWVHNASNSEFTHLTINEKRGQEGMDSGGVLPLVYGYRHS